MRYYRIIDTDSDCVAAYLGDHESAQLAAASAVVPCDHRIIRADDGWSARAVYHAVRAAIAQQCSAAGRAGAGDRKRRSADQCRAAARARWDRVSRRMGDHDAV